MILYIAQQIQTIKSKDGRDVIVEITQKFQYTPAVFYRSNGDPGDPESYDEIGEPKVTIIDGYADDILWVEDAIDWDSFYDTELKPE